MNGYYTAPAGSSYNLFVDVLKQPHLLIAGATGSGKSVVINSMIYTALYDFPKNKQFILIDPKRVELFAYSGLPHTIAYASEPREIPQTLNRTIDLMERRYHKMRRQGLKKSLDSDVYVIVDEYADLITTQKKQVLTPFLRLAQLGRAANIHLILATQRPTREIVSGQIKVNLDSRLALRCPTPQDSRNIINKNGAELLPRYGSGLYLTPETLRPVLVDVPKIEENEINRLINHWMNQKALTNSRF